MMGYELKTNPSNKKSNGTHVKMLIAEEMSKEPEFKWKPPSVVARLMGLDALPAQQSIVTLEKFPPEVYFRNGPPNSRSVPRNRHEENGFLDKHVMSEIEPEMAHIQQTQEYKDVYEVSHQPSKCNHAKDQSQCIGRGNENPNKKNMTCACQKFIEANHLVTDDERHRHSKEFQDALNVLSSNRDTFIKFLQEPNSLPSKHLDELQSIPSHPETKRITVLKPSKTVELDEKRMEKLHQVIQSNGFHKNKPSWSTGTGHPGDDNSSFLPTRIVVLKPNPRQTRDITATGSSPTSLLRLLQSGRDFQGFGIDGAKGSREITKEQENLSSSRGDESLLSSILLNGYTADESSFYKSESEQLEVGNLSESEIMTPTSRNSWDYVNKYSSPLSLSSFSKASSSTESSVSREAKRRLSERWALMAANGNQESHIWRSSSTLGDVLALPERRKLVISCEEGKYGGSIITCSRSCGGEHEFGGLSCISSGEKNEKGEEGTPKDLLRSRSVPLSSATYEMVGLNMDVLDKKSSKSAGPKEVTKVKSGKSSLRGKVSDLFFFRNKKPSKVKCGLSPPLGEMDESQSANLKMEESLQVRNRTDDVLDCETAYGFEEGQSLGVKESTCDISSPTSSSVGPKKSCNASEGVLSLEKYEAPELSGENLDQPSPISVLEALFEDRFSSTESSEKGNSESPSNPRLLRSSNATARSPLIESVIRSLPWDDATSETPTSSNSPGFLSISPPKPEVEERGLFQFVHTLLTSACLNHENLDAICVDCNLAEGPLHPSLLDKCSYWKEPREEPNDANRRQQRLERRLLFDCVNEALMEIVAPPSDAKPWIQASRRRIPPGASVTEEVWARVKEWSIEEARCCNESKNGQVVARAVGKEVEGRRWLDLMRLEVVGIANEVENKLLHDLVDEALVELTSELY